MRGVGCEEGTRFSDLQLTVPIMQPGKKGAGIVADRLLAYPGPSAFDCISGARRILRSRETIKELSATAPGVPTKVTEELMRSLRGRTILPQIQHLIYAQLKPHPLPYVRCIRDGTNSRRMHSILEMA